MAIPYRTTKFKSTNILAIAILGSNVMKIRKKLMLIYYIKLDHALYSIAPPSYYIMCVICILGGGGC